MQLDLGDSVVSKEVRKAENHHSISGNPLITRNDFDKVSLNDLDNLEEFTGKLQVSRILEKEDKTYNTAIIEVFDDIGQNKLTLFVNFDSRNEVINVDDTFDFYIDFFNICKSLNVIKWIPSNILMHLIVLMRLLFEPLKRIMVIIVLLCFLHNN